MDKVNTHHLFYPRNLYRKAGGIAWEFYQLPCNQIRIPVAVHNEAHERCQSHGLAPLEFMAQRVWMYKTGKCGCEHHPRPS